MGNRIAQARGKDQKLKTYYRYNALNQLEEVINNGQHIHYAYDPLGRRISKADGKTITHFLWMEDVLLSEHKKEQANNNPIEDRIYLFEPGTFKPLAFVQNKEIYHYHLDHLGTPQEISDANGNIVWAVSFKAYGNLAVAYEDQIENNLRFQGQYFDAETGLHYNRFRYYDPNCGRFINQDPIGLAGGNNNYLYVPNPTGWVDPFGLSAKDCPISVDEALDRASEFLKKGVPVRSIEGKTGIQFIQEYTENGQKITKRVGFDLNPNTSHVKQLGPHLNLQTQINGEIQKGALADPHIPIDPKTIRSGDY